MRYQIDQSSLGDFIDLLTAWLDISGISENDKNNSSWNSFYVGHSKPSCRVWE